GEGATIAEAAELVAREAIAARAQLTPLRQCENLAREGKTTEAAAAATAGVIAFVRAVPARVCLLNALVKLGSKPDSIMTVAKATLATSPANPVALEALAGAYDAVDKTADAAPMWV